MMLLSLMPANVDDGDDMATMALVMLVVVGGNRLRVYASLRIVECN